MSIIQWRPMGMIDPFEEMGKIMNDMSNMAQGQMKVFAPALDIYEKGDKVIAEMPLAGVAPEKVEINIEDNTLTVKGTSGGQTEVDEKNYYRKEVRQGMFYRAVTLPMPVIKDKAQAILENGILRIIIPKAPGMKAKNVPIKVKVASNKK